MFCQQMFGVSTLLLLLSILVPVVRGKYDKELAGLVGAGVAAFFLLVVIIILLAIFLTWNRWFPSVQRSKGKVKMPKSFWKKKREAKLRLLDTSRASRVTTSTHLENGHVTHNSRVKDTASWVQGWTISNRPETTGYEELALAMDLVEEEDSEYRIETTLEENPHATHNLGRPFVATAVVRGNSVPDPMKSTPTQTGFTETGEEGEEDSSEFRIVAAVVDNEALDLGPFKTIDTQTGARQEEGISEQTVSMQLGEEEHVTSYSQFLDSSRVAF